MLTHQIISVHYKNFTLQGKEYHTIADYFFQKKSIDDSTVACFQLFVQHGLSLMELDTSTRLPFAAVLLLTPRHPYKTVLDQNPILFRDNSLFYQQLNQVLKLISSQADCPKEQIKKIQELITHNSIQISWLNSTESKNPSIAKPRNKIIALTEAELGTALIGQLMIDPEIKTLIKVIKKAEASLMQTFSRQQKTNFNLEIKTMLSQLEDHFNSTEPGDIPSYEVLKKMIARLLVLGIENINTREQLAQVQKELKCPCSPKILKRLCAKEKQLLLRFNEIKKEEQNRLQ